MVEGPAVRAVGREQQVPGGAVTAAYPRQRNVIAATGFRQVLKRTDQDDFLFGASGAAAIGGRSFPEHLRGTRWLLVVFLSAMLAFPERSRTGVLW